MRPHDATQHSAVLGGEPHQPVDEPETAARERIGRPAHRQRVEPRNLLVFNDDDLHETGRPLPGGQPYKFSPPWLATRPAEPLCAPIALEFQDHSFRLKSLREQQLHCKSCSFDYAHYARWAHSNRSAPPLVKTAATGP